MTGIKLTDLFDLERAHPRVSLPGGDRFKGEVLNIQIQGIAFDSRNVQPGSIFVALSGDNTDGHRYIPDAVTRGAVAVVGEATFTQLSVPYIQVDDSRLALANISAAFYGFPSRKMTILGVTGTDGKTTTSTLIHHILQAAGLKTGMISTVSALIGSRVLDTGFHVTTPESPDIQSYLAQMAGAGLTHVVIEATSHGLAQHRVSACDFDAGVVTNITHEHLDYHGSYQAYREAKARLFYLLAQTPPKEHGPLRVAVLNRDDSSFEHLMDLIDEINARTSAPLRTITYGVHREADLRAEKITYESGGLGFQVLVHGKRLSIKSHLSGAYNVSNCLAAIAATGIGLYIDGQAVQEGIWSMTGIPGRMERVEMGQEFLAIVDFAHTPNALRQTLTAARQMLEQTSKNGRIISIFGSAGLRDRAKRRMMAEISAELADISILTTEDPRTESLGDILVEMAAGAESGGGVEGSSFWCVPDRGEAIRLGVNKARPGDLVIALGKGHEQSMCFGEIEFPWDDRIAFQAALGELLGIHGPEMPYLPTQDQSDI